VVKSTAFFRTSPAAGRCAAGPQPIEEKNSSRAKTPRRKELQIGGALARAARVTKIEHNKQEIDG